MENTVWAKARYQYRSDTAENWGNANPILLAGEHGVVIDSDIPHQREKIGDGETPWNELGWYHGPQGEVGPQGEKGEKGDDGITPIVDLNYNPDSQNPQSGVAIAGALANFNGGGNRGIWKKIVNITTTSEVNGIIATVDEFPQIANCNEFIIRAIFPNLKDTTLCPSQINIGDAIVFTNPVSYIGESEDNETQCHIIIADDLIFCIGTPYNTTYYNGTPGILVSDNLVSEAKRDIMYFLTTVNKTMPVGTQLIVYGKVESKSNNIFIAWPDISEFQILSMSDFEVDNASSGKLPVIEPIHNQSNQEDGVKFIWNGGDHNSRIISTQKYNVDDLYLRFNNIKKSDLDNNPLKFVIALAKTTTEEPPFKVLVDTVSGSVSYYNQENLPVAVIINNNLKYDVISKNEFIIGFNVNAAGDVICKVKVGETELIGTIPAKFGSTVTSTTSKRHIFISPFDLEKNCFSTDVTGIVYDQFTRPTYASELLTGYSPTCSIENIIYNNCWQGEKITFLNGANEYRTAYSTFAPEIDGLVLRFDGLKKTAGYENENLKFAISLSRPDEIIYPNVRAIIDTDAGTLSFCRHPNDESSNGAVWANRTIIATDEILRYNNIKNKEFTVKFDVLPSHDVDVTITVGNQSVTGQFPEEYYDYYMQTGGQLTENGNFYVGPGANDPNHFSVRYTGYFNTQATTEEQEEES